jgi:hypothetical protein
LLVEVDKAVAGCSAFGAMEPGSCKQVQKVPKIRFFFLQKVIVTTKKLGCCADLCTER